MDKLNELLARLRSIRIRLPGNIRLPRVQRLSVGQIILWGVALAVAITLFVFLRGFTACWQVTALPGMRPSSCPGPASALEDLTIAGTAAVPPPSPTQEAIPEVTYPTWDGGSRINIAFFGLRGGDTSGEDCPLCTDTIIVFTVDPVSKTAGMMSIPRDMFVNIPGFGFSRINTAWTSGEGAKLPGGGPALAMKTVSQFLGVPINYYVQVDFQTFVDFIDMIHGIDVYNDENLRLQKLGGGRDTIRITCCGMRHLGGDAALAFARCRDAEQGCTDGDVGRSKRQQKVIMAVRDKVFDPKRFPELMAQAPQLYNLFSSGIHTNMTLDEAIKLAALVNNIPVGKIRQGVIEDNMVNYGNVTLGGQNASIIMPIPDKIREVRDNIFTVGGATSPGAKGDPRSLMKFDGSLVRITNDSSTPDLDTRTGNFLLSKGVKVTERGAPTGIANQTVVILYKPDLYTLRYLIKPLGMITSGAQIIFKPDPTQSVDMEIRLGNDWVSRLPAGF